MSRILSEQIKELRKRIASWKSSGDTQGNIVSGITLFLDAAADENDPIIVEGVHLMTTLFKKKLFCDESKSGQDITLDDTDKWTTYYLKLATKVSEASKNPSKTNWRAILGAVAIIIGSLVIAAAFAMLSGPLALPVAMGGAALVAGGLIAIIYSCNCAKKSVDWNKLLPPVGAINTHMGSLFGLSSSQSAAASLAKKQEKLAEERSNSKAEEAAAKEKAAKEKAAKEKAAEEEAKRQAAEEKTKLEAEEVHRQAEEAEREKAEKDKQEAAYQAAEEEKAKLEAKAQGEAKYPDNEEDIFLRVAKSLRLDIEPLKLGHEARKIVKAQIARDALDKQQTEENAALELQQAETEKIQKALELKESAEMHLKTRALLDKTKKTCASLEREKAFAGKAIADVSKEIADLQKKNQATNVGYQGWSGWWTAPDERLISSQKVLASTQERLSHVLEEAKELTSRLASEREIFERLGGDPDASILGLLGSALAAAGGAAVSTVRNINVGEIVINTRNQAVSFVRGETSAQKALAGTATVAENCAKFARGLANTGKQALNVMGSATSELEMHDDPSSLERVAQTVNSVAKNPFMGGLEYVVNRSLSRVTRSDQIAAVAHAQVNHPPVQHSRFCLQIAGVYSFTLLACVRGLRAPLALIEGTVTGPVSALERLSHAADVIRAKSEKNLRAQVGLAREGFVGVLEGARVALTATHGENSPHVELIKKIEGRVTGALEGFDQNANLNSALVFAGQTHRGVDASVKVVTTYMALGKVTSWVEHLGKHPIIPKVQYTPWTDGLAASARVAMYLNAMAAMQELSSVVTSAWQMGDPLNPESPGRKQIQAVLDHISRFIPASEDWPEENFPDRFALFEMLQSDQEDSFVRQAKPLIWNLVYKKLSSIAANLAGKPAKLAGAAIAGMGYRGWHSLDTAIPPGSFDHSGDAAFSECLQSTAWYYFVGALIEEVGGLCLEHVAKGAVFKKLQPYEKEMSDAIDRTARDMLKNILFNPNEQAMAEKCLLRKVQQIEVRGDIQLLSPIEATILLRAAIAENQGGEGSQNALALQACPVGAASRSSLVDAAQKVTTGLLQGLNFYCSLEREPSLISDPAKYIQKKAREHPTAVSGVSAAGAVVWLMPMIGTVLYNQAYPIIGVSVVGLGGALCYKQSQHVRDGVSCAKIAAKNLLPKVIHSSANAIASCGSFMKTDQLSSSFRVVVAGVLAGSAAYRITSGSDDFAASAGELTAAAVIFIEPSCAKGLSRGVRVISTGLYDVTAYALNGVVWELPKWGCEATMRNGTALLSGVKNRWRQGFFCKRQSAAVHDPSSIPANRVLQKLQKIWN